MFIDSIKYLYYTITWIIWSKLAGCRFTHGKVFIYCMDKSYTKVQYMRYVMLKYSIDTSVYDQILRDYEDLFDQFYEDTY